MEVLYFVILLAVLINLLRNNGTTYNIAPNILTLLLALFVICIYGIGRTRLRYHFVTATLSNESHKAKVWLLIRNITAIVIAANIGVIIVQLYSAINVRNFDELVEASNNPVALTFFVFQDICIFVAQVAVYYYLLKSYLTYRKSLFVEEDDFVENEDAKDTGKLEASDMESKEILFEDKKNRSNIPVPEPLKNISELL